MFGFRIIRQYEQGIVFRFGRALPGVRKPGLIWINPFTSRLTKVNMQIAVASVPAQETITRDNVTLKVDAVVYYRVVDPLKAIINVQNYHFAVSQVAQTSLRAVTGRSNMDQLLSEREQVNAELKDVIDAPTEGPWGDPGGTRRGQGHLAARIDETLHVPAGRSRTGAPRPDHRRRRRVPGLQEAGPGRHGHGRRPGGPATAAAADRRRGRRQKNSTLVMPFPVELLRFFDRASLTASASLASTGAEESLASTGAEDAAALPAPPALPATVLANPPASRPATVAPNGLRDPGSAD